ncbi:hypothetical protein [uncultured Sphaerochaeta sp.]|nr:hypothetical protein [uncultured Sphaerochaeta sp.]
MARQRIPRIFIMGLSTTTPTALANAPLVPCWESTWAQITLLH